jgi:predicted aldo/keto reductase-like oxidoreductase
MMLYREMPKTGDKLSILGFGCMRLPGGQMNPDEKKSIEQIRYAIDRGVNYLDTAWTYHNGKSEVILGKALKDGYRDKVKIADKLPHWVCKTREDLDYYLDVQMERLG